MSKRILHGICAGQRNLMVQRLCASSTLIGTLLSCTSSSVPIDASLKITPAEHTIEVVESVDEDGRCLFSESNYLDIPMTVTLSTSNGSPIGDEAIRVYTDFSENTLSGSSVLSLYDDANSNGVVDADVELVSGYDDGIFQTQTGKYSGTKTFLLRVNLSCAFRGEVRVIADPISATAVIAVDQMGRQKRLSVRGN